MKYIAKIADLKIMVDDINSDLIHKTMDFIYLNKDNKFS